MIDLEKIPQLSTAETPKAAKPCVSEKREPVLVLLELLHIGTVNFGMSWREAEKSR